MGELGEKLKGHGNTHMGDAKQAVGDLTDNEKLKAKGARQELKGESQKLKGEIEGALGNDV